MRSTLARAAQASVTAAGIACPLVTGAGTGTFVLEAASGVYGELQAGSYVFMDRDYADNQAAPQRAGLRARAVRQEPGDEPRHLARRGRRRPQVARDRLRPAARVAARDLEFANGGDEHGILRRRAATRCRRWARRSGWCPATATRRSTCTTTTSVVRGGLEHGRVEASGRSTHAAASAEESALALTGPQVIVLATPVFLALIAHRVRWSAGRAGATPTG